MSLKLHHDIKQKNELQNLSNLLTGKFQFSFSDPYLVPDRKVWLQRFFS